MFTFWSERQPQDEFDPDEVPIGRLPHVVGHEISQQGLIGRVGADEGFWRVRVHSGIDHRFGSSDLGSAPRQFATANRMGPAGVSMFYGAIDYETAALETVDPSEVEGKYVTGARFVAADNLYLVDLTRIPSVGFFSGASRDAQETARFLRRFAGEVSAPVDRHAVREVEYVPTQAFAEFIRFEFSETPAPEGIMFQSSKTAGLSSPCSSVMMHARYDLGW